MAMFLENDQLKHRHTLQQFDNELNYLHGLIVEMSYLVLRQWELASQAMELANLDAALAVVSQANKVYDYESAIDAEILLLLAKESPVANDLRMILSVSKIAVELKVLGDEIVGIAKLIMKLNRPRCRASSASLLSDLAQIPQLIRTMLGNLVVVVSSGQSKQAHLMMDYEFDCERELQQGIKQQLTVLNDDSRQISSALKVLQILKAMESCGEHCKNIAEYCIFMIDGIDMRHSRRRKADAAA
jgi:phosphate transport system protein